MRIFSMMNTMGIGENISSVKSEREASQWAWRILLIVNLALVFIILAVYIELYSSNKPADYINLVSAIATIVLASITVITLFENRRITQNTLDIANESLEETRLMREAQTEPIVLVRIQPREEYINWIDMIIENVGPGAARDVKFSISSNVDDLTGTKVSEMGFVKHGFSNLASGQKFQFILTDMADRPEEKENASFTIDVNYNNSVGRPYHDTYTIDFSELAGLTQLGTPPLHDIASALVRMERDIDRISSGWNRMKVIAYTPEDIKKENEERLARNRSMTRGNIEEMGESPPPDK